MLIKKLHDALQEIADERTKQELGDRSTYLGASEIGKCPRKVILGKFYPVKHSLKSLLLFERGHMTEDIIFKALVKAGINPVRQFECRYNESSSGLVIKAHLDFTIAFRNTILVIECKSVGSAGIPSVGYEEHEEQLLLQLNLAQRQYPGKEVKGAILYVSMDGEMELFSGKRYVPSREVFLDQIYTAQGIWETYKIAQGVTDVVGYCNTIDTTPGPLCAYCDYSRGCPRITSRMMIEMREFVDETYLLHLELKKKKSALDARKKQLMDFLAKSGLRQFETGEHVVRHVSQNRTKVDYESLEQDMADYGMELDEYRSPFSVDFPEIKPVTDWISEAA